GRMGANMARRLARGGVKVAAYDRSTEARAAVGDEPGVRAHGSLEALVGALATPRVIWVMLPAGEVTEGALAELLGLGLRDDVVVEGGNSMYKDSQRRAAWFRDNGVGYVDAGVSGGIWGLENGYALMLGGDAADVARVTPFARILAPSPDAGWLHCG